MKFRHETHIAFNDLHDQFAKGRSSYRGKRQKNHLNDLAFFRREDGALFFFANFIPFICRIIYNKWRIRENNEKNVIVLSVLLTRCNKFIIIFSIVELYLQ